VRNGLYDGDAFAVMRALLKEGDAFVDVGANIGPYSVLAATAIGRSGLVVAFEPEPSQLPYLRTNLSNVAPDCEIFPCAVSDKEGTSGMGGAGATTRYLVPGEDPSIDEIAVTTLDATLMPFARDWSRSLVKIDVEGFEPAVVLGAGELLRARPKGLLIEANGLQDRCHVRWSDAVQVLHDASYAFVWPDKPSRVLWRFPAPDPRSPFSNYLVLRPDVVSDLARSGGMLQRAWQ
jgi:FkbM family methyltransferase